MAKAVCMVCNVIGWLCEVHQDQPARLHLWRRRHALPEVQSLKQS
jgi:hypothetical protein